MRWWEFARHHCNKAPFFIIYVSLKWKSPLKIFLFRSRKIWITSYHLSFGVPLQIPHWIYWNPWRTLLYLWLLNRDTFGFCILLLLLSPRILQPFSFQYQSVQIFVSLLLDDRGCHYTKEFLSLCTHKITLILFRPYEEGWRPLPCRHNRRSI